MAAVEAEGLVKIDRSRGLGVRALDGVDLEGEEGTVVRRAPSLHECASSEGRDQLRPAPARLGA